MDGHWFRSSCQTSLAAITHTGTMKGMRPRNFVIVRAMDEFCRFGRSLEFSTAR